MMRGGIRIIYKSLFLLVVCGVFLFGVTSGAFAYFAPAPCQGPLNPPSTYNDGANGGFPYEAGPPPQINQFFCSTEGTTPVNGTSNQYTCAEAAADPAGNLVCRHYLNPSTDYYTCSWYGLNAWAGSNLYNGRLFDRCTRAATPPAVSLAASPASIFATQSSTLIWTASSGNTLWTQLTANGAAGSPTARVAHKGAWDRQNNRFLVFGGNDGVSGDLNDLWSWSPSAGWVQLTANGAAGSPPARVGHGVAWDTQSNRLLVYGGVFYNDLWSWSPSAGWVQLTANGAAGSPLGRSMGETVWDTQNNRLLMFGGLNFFSGSRNDLWSWSPSAGWVQLTANGAAGSPPARYAHHVTWDTQNNRLLMFGGFSLGVNGGIHNDLWSWSPSAGWVQLTADGAAGSAPARAYGGISWDTQSNSRLLVFGGDNNGGGGQSNDLWSWSPSAGWVQLTANGAAGSPPWRNQHTAIWGMDRLLVFGGRASGVVNDLWAAVIPSAVACSATSPAGWTPSTAPSGSQVVSPVSTTTYTMSCTNAVGTTSASATITVSPPPDTTAPSTPTGVSAVAVSTTQINISWAASTDNIGGSGLAGYQVYRNGALIATVGTGLAYSDVGLTPSTTYAYTIAARDNAGNFSAQSAPPVSATTWTPPDTAAPSPPPTLSTGGVTSSSIALFWTASDDTGGSGFQGYRVYRNGTMLLVTLGPAFLSHSDSAVAPLTTYTYRVDAYDGAGNIASSNTVSVTTPPPPDITPPVFTPTGPPASLPMGTTTATLQGTTNESATCRYATTAGRNFDTQMTSFTTTAAASHSQPLTGLTDGTTYFYYVKCRDASNNTSPDVSASFSIEAPPPDFTPPAIFDHRPTTGAIIPAFPAPPGTGTVTMSVNTNENAYCRYSQTASTLFSAMTDSFLSADFLYHTAQLTVTNGISYTYYVRCQDTPASNVNTSDYIISFSVALPANISPLAVLIASPTSGVAGVTVFSASGAGSSDPDGSIAAYVLNWGDGSPVITNATGAFASHTYLIPGSYFVTLTVTDDRGASAQVNQSVTVNPPPDIAAPVISNAIPSGTLPYNTGSTIMSVTTNEDASCRYNQNTDTAFSSMPATQTLVSSDRRYHSINLSVSNGATYVYYIRCQDVASPPNETASGQRIAFDVSGTFNALPIATIVSATPSSGNPPLFVSVVGQGTDPNGSIVQYIWDWGDGSPRTLGLQTTSHAYTSIGTSTLTLTVVDNQNQSGSVTQQITVSALPVQPTGNICTASCTSDPECGFPLIPSVCGPAGICIAAGSVGPGPLRFDGGASLSNGTNAQLSLASFSAGTTAVIMSVKTDVEAQCQYSAAAGAAYGSASMSQLTTTNNTTHTVRLSGLRDQAYVYYVRCRDRGTGDVNTSDYPVSLTVGSSAIVTARAPHICSINENFIRNNMPWLYDICRLETTDAVAPTWTTVSGLVATPSAAPLQVGLSWNGATDVGSGVAGYRVYRRLISDTGFAQIAIVRTGTTYIDRSVASGTGYVYYVRAFDRAGNISIRPSDRSDEVTVTTP